MIGQHRKIAIIFNITNELLLFSCCNITYHDYTGLLFIVLIVRYDPQSVRYDPHAHLGGSRYDHMSCPLRSTVLFFRWRFSRV